jgi:hypothetical protein
MKIIRIISLGFALLVPVAAIASPKVREPAPCCSEGCCPDCPFCPMSMHHS